MSRFNVCIELLLANWYVVVSLLAYTYIRCWKCVILLLVMCFVSFCSFFSVLAVSVSFFFFLYITVNVFFMSVASSICLNFCLDIGVLFLCIRYATSMLCVVVGFFLFVLFSVGFCSICTTSTAVSFALKLIAHGRTTWTSRIVSWTDNYRSVA